MLVNIFEMITITVPGQEFGISFHEAIVDVGLSRIKDELVAIFQRAQRVCPVGHICRIVTRFLRLGPGNLNQQEF